MRHRPSNAVIAALVCLGGLVLTGVIALGVPLAESHDQATLNSFTSLQRGSVNSVAQWVAHLVDPGGFAICAVAFSAVAVARRRARVAVAVPMFMLAASACTEILKPLVAQPRLAEWLDGGPHLVAESWPSGHATAAMSIALGAVLVAPRVLRPLFALLGTGLAVAVGYAILLLGWHFPSDVLGGYFVSGAWAALALSVIWWADRRWPARSGRRAVARATQGLVLPAAIVVIAAGGGIGALLARGGPIAPYLTTHASFVAGAAAIATLAAALQSGFAVALGRWT